MSTILPQSPVSQAPAPTNLPNIAELRDMLAERGIRVVAFADGRGRIEINAGKVVVLERAGAK